MASEWVGVVGTAIGAGIGGVVTVASLIVKGRQDEAAQKRHEEREDKQRADDRTWSVRQQNVDKRREIYSEMLAVAEQINTSLEIIDPSMQRITLGATPYSWEQLSELIDRLDTNRIVELIDRFSTERARATLAAVDRSVIDVARNVLRSAQTISDVAQDDRWRGRMDIVLTEVQSLQTLVLMLQDACRRDLGFEAWPVEDSELD